MTTPAYYIADFIMPKSHFKTFCSGQTHALSTILCLSYVFTKVIIGSFWGAMTFSLTAQATMTQGWLEMTYFIAIVQLVVYDVILKVAYDFLYKSSYTMTWNSTMYVLKANLIVIKWLYYLFCITLTLWTTKTMTIH